MANQPNKPPVVVPPISIPEGDTIGMRLRWTCLRCGSGDLASAYLLEFADDKFRSTRIAPKGLKLTRIARMMRPYKQLLPVTAIVCRDCGAVQLEVDPEEFKEMERKYGRR